MIITLESNRIMVSNLDLDSNAMLYDLKSTREPDYHVMAAQIYVNSLTAYIGEMAQLIRYERPGIKIATNIFNHLTDPDYTYIEANGRKWNATLLTAVFLKRVIQKVEESVTKRISEVAFIVHPSIENAEVQRELKTALGYYNLELHQVYNYSSAILTYLHERSDLASGHILMLHCDYYSTYAQLVQVKDGKSLQTGYKAMDTLTKEHSLRFLLECVKEEAVRLLGFQPSDSDKNQLVLDEIVDDLYRSMIIKGQASVTKPVFLDSKPVILSFEKGKIQQYIQEKANYLTESILSLLDEVQLPYTDISYWVVCGEYADSLVIKAGLQPIIESDNKLLITDETIIAKGGAYLSYDEPSIASIAKVKLSIASSASPVSIIQLDMNNAETYIVFDAESTPKYTSLTVNLSKYEQDLSEANEIKFVHYLDRLGTQEAVGYIIVKHDAAFFPAQLQLNIIRSGDVFNNLQAIDFENDQILEVSYQPISSQKVITPEVTETLLRPSIKIGRNKANVLKVKSKAAKPVDTDVAVAPAISIRSTTQSIATDNAAVEKPSKIKINKKMDKVKIEIKSDDIKDKFQEILEIIVINNVK